MYKLLLLTLTVLILGSCAQTSSIEGGPKDELPPRVVKNGLTPNNESIHFDSKEIQFKFNEFIQVNNPTQTITVSPEDFKVDVVSKGKSMTLKINGEPKPQTTYVITLNGTVKDFTEGNDSLMQYVFSTGDFIDSLTYSGVVIDAKEETPVANCFVGLFDTNDSAIYNKPNYFSTTDNNGIFTFKYLKPGTFQLFAFTDLNKDSKWQNNERMAFIDETITIDTTQQDSLYLRLFQPELTQKINATITYPCKVTIAGRKAIDIKELSFNNNDIPLENLVYYSPDSLSFVFDSVSDKSYQLILTHSEDKLVTDTFNIRPPIVNKKRKLNPTFEFIGEKESYLKGDTAVFLFTDKLTKIDTSKMELLIHDSIKIPINIYFENQHLYLIFDSVSGSTINLNVSKGGIFFANYQDSIVFTHLFKITDLSSSGTLSLDMGKLPDNAVVEMYLNQQLSRTFILAETGKKIKLEKLPAGEYQFKAFIDEDGNKLWTTGDYLSKRQPEKIIRFKDTVKVRPLWDIEASLEPLEDDKE